MVPGSSPGGRKKFDPCLWAGVNFLCPSKQTALLATGLEGRSDVRVLPKAKASTASPGLEAFCVSKKTVRQVLVGAKNLTPAFGQGLIFYAQASKLLCLRQDLKDGAMCEFCRRQRRVPRVPA